MIITGIQFLAVIINGAQFVRGKAMSLLITSHIPINLSVITQI